MHLVSQIRTYHPSSPNITLRTSDPCKDCTAPNCTNHFFRRPNEAASDYNKRDTCSKTCGRAKQTATRALNSTLKEYDYREIDKTQLSCVNCNWMMEDSELGEHCGKCSSGQKFKMKEKK